MLTQGVTAPVWVSAPYDAWEYQLLESVNICRAAESWVTESGAVQEASITSTLVVPVAAGAAWTVTPELTADAVMSGPVSVPLTVMCAPGRGRALGGRCRR